MEWGLEQKYNVTAVEVAPMGFTCIDLLVVSGQSTELWSSEKPFCEEYEWLPPACWEEPGRALDAWSASKSHCGQCPGPVLGTSTPAKHSCWSGGCILTQWLYLAKQSTMVNCTNGVAMCAVHSSSSVDISDVGMKGVTAVFIWEQSCAVASLDDCHFHVKNSLVHCEIFREKRSLIRSELSQGHHLERAGAALL